MAGGVEGCYSQTVALLVMLYDKLGVGQQGDFLGKSLYLTVGQFLVADALDVALLACQNGIQRLAGLFAFGLGFCHHLLLLFLLFLLGLVFPLLFLHLLVGLVLCV